MRTTISSLLAGNEKSINSGMFITEQADKLAYDTSYDMNMEDLSLGTLLGSGTFGEVMQAEVKELAQGEQRTTVAAKRVKDVKKEEYNKALITELKIMIYVGSHPNVIKILGVVRTNIINGMIS